MSRLKINIFLLSLIISGFGSISSQTDINLDKYRTDLNFKDISHYHLKGRKHFSARQNIHILAIPKELIGNGYDLDLAWSDSALHKTSTFASREHAIAAVNAGFFNVREGGSVSYLEDENEMVSRRSWRGDPADFQTTNLNGALILNRQDEIVIEEAENARYYLNSNKEKWVLVTGPILISGGMVSNLLGGTFVENRHPRTCIGLTKDKLLLITVDGRNKKAKGMDLYELQTFLADLGCIDAINLDGGGSTSMWVKSSDLQRVINCPSDNGQFNNQGERKVANALLLIKN